MGFSKGLKFLKLLGIPLRKVAEYPDILGESASSIVSQVNELGMAELSLFSQENCWIRGELATLT